MKLNYTEPKIFTGGVDITQWSALDKKQRNDALAKAWFVYFSFRDPDTGKLKKQPFIKAGANRFKGKTKRLQFLKVLQRNLLLLLEAGFDPYKDNTELEDEFRRRAIKEERPINNFPAKKEVEKESTAAVNRERIDLANENAKPNPVPISEIENNVVDENKVSVAEAFELGLNIKKSTLNDNSFKKQKSRITKFERWLAENEVDVSDINNIDKKTVVRHLNDVLRTSSPRNRNNTRTALSALFGTLENNELIDDNFIRKINILKSVPKRNKTYTPTQLAEIDAHLMNNDLLMRMFVQMVSYNMLRPIEICRLKVGDIDINDKKIYVKAKNKPVKIKIIPDIMLGQLPDLSKMDAKHSLFTPQGFGGEWNLADNDKRNYFSKRFKKVKDHFNLGNEYGLYSFRHTYITMLYREMIKTGTPEEVKSKLMLITGHATLDALEKYLRDIDAELPQDYSNLLNRSINKTDK
ncbi:tyrosine-type recombinase/integrase [Zobellia alginiliquefaciens]|uniref:tyrosine-type recombinase/integrase n=1 Tax=Zobellia alginiliquefaciens TaxID=3032586 RepID=UPI0023E477CB|nr:site-specific integrase [Zobellia alginiliquefaciens]